MVLENRREQPSLSTRTITTTTTTFHYFCVVRDFQFIFFLPYVVVRKIHAFAPTEQVAAFMFQKGIARYTVFNSSDMLCSPAPIE